MNNTDEQRIMNHKTNRRSLLKTIAAAGIGSAVFQRALAALAENATQVTPEMVQQAEWISGLTLSEEQREETAGSLNSLLQKFAIMRSVPVDYDTPSALTFHPGNFVPSPPRTNETTEVAPIEMAAARRPASDEDLAFLPLTELAALLRAGKVSSVDLTKLYLRRLRQYDPLLHCVVTYTDDLALRQAAKADREMAAGRYRGPLHGIPWGAKDLMAYPGYNTTWGAAPFRDQSLETTATVAKRLEDAGAVLVAKLSLGALAMGDQWFGGMTRNPWNPEQGSSGSSAGSASAVAAGLVGFAIGSETLGSIVSPCKRCGTTGLRPTFGRVSRYGCMPLAWSMDKIGPIARSVEDCALIFGAIHGADGLDPTAVDRGFRWPSPTDLRHLRVGFVETASDANRAELQILDKLGVKLQPIKLPSSPPAAAMTMILNVEAATVFDELTRSGVTEGLNRWPKSFRQGEFTPAVEYLRANRLRTTLIVEMEKVFDEVDLYVGGNDLAITNLTGHPTAVLPNGFVTRDGRELPQAITFTGRLFGETDLLSVAYAYQQATDFHLRRPPLAEFEADATAASSADSGRAGNE